MPLMVTIQPWVFITTCLSRQYDLNSRKTNFFLFRKKCPQAGFEPGTPTINPEHIHPLDCSATATARAMAMVFFTQIQSVTTIMAEALSITYKTM